MILRTGGGRWQRRLVNRARRGVPYHGREGRTRAHIFLGALYDMPQQYSGIDSHPLDSWLGDVWHANDADQSADDNMRLPGDDDDLFPLQRTAFQRRFLSNFITRIRRWARRVRARAARRLNLVRYAVVTDMRALVLATRGQII